MKLDGSKIIEILLRQNYISEQDVKQAKEYIKTHNVLMTDYILSKNLITKDLLGQAIAEAYGIKYADLNSRQPSKEQIHKIPEELAKKSRVVLFDYNDNGVTIATDSPDQQNLGTDLKNIFPQKQIHIAFSLSEDIDKALRYYRKPLETRFVKIIEDKKRVAPEIIDEIIGDALHHKASDIHFEPQDDIVIVRFRVDGVLQEAGSIPKEYYENILNRVKVYAKMRIDEHNASQDGSIRYHPNQQEKVDLRISVVPTISGEKIAIRILSEYVRELSLDNLGLSSENRQIIQKASQKPFGMILVTGPTGSGKTTTLYSLLKTINDPGVNITTIEDPAEYKIPGINQIQVNEKTNLSFAKGLRSIVRQDPDIILVGEIRDEETAEIAVNAALTGHLLLSTFHSNDASTAIPRLLDMGVEPFLLASTLELVIAQRLVRRICENCRVSISDKDDNYRRAMVNLPEKYQAKLNTLYKGKGCEVCSNTGYKGRVAIFEIIPITPEIEHLILKNPSKQEIWQLASQQDSKSLFEDGLNKVQSGETTLSELLRIAPLAKKKINGR